MKFSDYQNVIFNLIFIISACFFMFSSCTMNKEWDDYYHDSSVNIGDNVLKLIEKNANYSRFYETILATGYDSLLIKNQYFTIFVPTNSAFDGLPEYTNAEWKNIIGFHICYYSLYSRDFGDIDLQSIIGKYLKIRKADNEESKIFNANINMDNVDVNCQNGVIHEIDQVLIPKQNIYEYITELDDDYSLLKRYLNSMDHVYIDLEKSVRIGVDDNGNTIYDTVWAKDNFFLDNIALLNHETENYTTMLATDQAVLQFINTAEEYFGNINDLDEKSFLQLLSIVFSVNFYEGIYDITEMPDTLTSVVGKKINTIDLNFSNEVNIEMSNGIIHLLDAVNIPKEFFLYPIIIECDEKKGRRPSNTIYITEIRSDTRATNGTFLYYGSKFVGDYIEWSVDMVLATTYWIIWTGPALGGSYLQVSIDGINVGDSVECYYKGNFKPVISGSYAFDKFGTKTVRITIVSEETLPGYNSMYLDYIKLIPDELYNQ